MEPVAPEVEDRLAYSLAETARLLSVSKRTVERLLASGTLAAVTIGGHRRIPRSELYRLLDTGQPQAQEAL